MSKKFLENIKDDVGYYCINEHYDLSDFIMFSVFLFIAVALGINHYIQSLNGESSMIWFATIVIGSILLIPFLIHFSVKSVKIINYRRKKKRCIENGIRCRGRIVDEKVGKMIFHNKIEGKIKYEYYPVVEYYCNGVLIRETSAYPYSNPYKEVLSDTKVTVYKNKNDLILTDITTAYQKENSVRTMEKTFETRKKATKIKFSKKDWLAFIIAILICLVVIALKSWQIILRIFT